MPKLDRFEEGVYKSALFQTKYLQPRYSEDTEGVPASAIERALGLPKNSFSKVRFSRRRSHDRDTVLITAVPQHASDINKWLGQLESDPDTRFVVLAFIRKAMHDMLSAEPGYSPLDLSASAFASVLFECFMINAASWPRPQLSHFLHQTTIWAALARILDGRAPNPGNVVHADLVRANLRRLLESAKEYIDPTPGGNVHQILDLLVDEFAYIADLDGSGLHFEAETTIATLHNMKVSRVVVTRPGEKARGQRVASKAGSLASRYRIVTEI